MTDLVRKGVVGGGNWTVVVVVVVMMTTRLVVKASASRAQDPGFESHLRRDFFGVESYQ